MYKEENVNEMVITYMIGKCNGKANKIEDALKILTKNITCDSNYWFTDVKSPLMEMKMRSLFEYGRLKFHLKEYQTANASLNEFHETVTKFPERQDLKEWFSEWWVFIGDINTLLTEAKDILNKLSLIDHVQSKDNIPDNISKALMTFRAARLAYEYSEDAEISKDSNEPLALDCILEEYKDPNTIQIKMLFLKQAKHQFKLQNHSEAIKIFDHIREDLNMKKYFRLKPQKKSELQEQTLQWGFDSFYSVFFPFSECLVKFNMYEEIISLFEDAILRFKDTLSEENKYQLYKMYELHTKICINNGDFMKAIHFVKEAKQFAFDNKLSKFCNASHDMKYAQSMANLCTYNKEAELKLCRMIQSPSEKKEKISKNLQYWTMLGQEVSQYYMATCHYHLCDFSRSIRILEDGKAAIEKGSPAEQLMKRTLSVYRCLLALKVKDFTYPLIYPLRLPSSFSGSLDAFKEFNIDSDAFEYMNLQSCHWILPNPKEDVKLKRKWRLFKNTALIIGNVRRTSQTLMPI